MQCPRTQLPSEKIRLQPTPLTSNVLLSGKRQTQRPNAMHWAPKEAHHSSFPGSPTILPGPTRLATPQELVESCRTASFESLERTTAVDESPRQPSRAPNSRGKQLASDVSEQDKVFFKKKILGDQSTLGRTVGQLDGPFLRATF